jgi:hypothetical protein
MGDTVSVVLDRLRVLGGINSGLRAGQPTNSTQIRDWINDLGLRLSVEDKWFVYPQKLGPYGEGVAVLVAAAVEKVTGVYTHVADADGNLPT